jgi:hypothetical protein
MRLAQAVFVIAVLGVLAYSLSFLGLLGGTRGPTTPATAEPDLVLGLGVRDVMIVVISVIVLGCSLFVILSKRYDDATQKWAFGAVGTIIGFWLKTT